MKLFWFLVILVLAGCGGNHWVHSSRTQVQLKEDQAQCRNQSGQASLATGADTVMAAAFRQQSYEECLLEKGWYTQEFSDTRTSKMAQNRTIAEQNQRIQELEAALALERTLSEQARQILKLEAELEEYRKAQSPR